MFCLIGRMADDKDIRCTVCSGSASLCLCHYARFSSNKVPSVNTFVYFVVANLNRSEFKNVDIVPSGFYSVTVWNAIACYALSNVSCSISRGNQKSIRLHCMIIYCSMLFMSSHNCFSKPQINIMYRTSPSHTHTIHHVIYNNEAHPPTATVQFMAHSSKRQHCTLEQ